MPFRGLVNYMWKSKTKSLDCHAFHSSSTKPVTTLFSMLILVNSVRLYLLVIASLIQNASLAI